MIKKLGKDARFIVKCPWHKWQHLIYIIRKIKRNPLIIRKCQWLNVCDWMNTIEAGRLEWNSRNFPVEKLLTYTELLYSTVHVSTFYIIHWFWQINVSYCFNKMVLPYKSNPWLHFDHRNHEYIWLRKCFWSFHKVVFFFSLIIYFAFCPINCGLCASVHIKNKYSNPCLSHVFVVDTASQTGDTDCSQAPGLTMNNHCIALYFVFCLCRIMTEKKTNSFSFYIWFT